jgi:hypothetical protein
MYWMWVFSSSPIYSSWFSLTMVDGKVTLSLLLLSESQSKTDGDGNTHTHACKYKSIFE